MHKIPYSKTMSCGVWVRQGSKYEEDDTSGLSHLIEHLMVNNASNNEKYKKIISEITSFGVLYNAGTTKETTSYYFTGLSNMIQSCIKALASIIMDNRNFTLDNLENEKKVVVQEATSFYSSFNQIKERTSQSIWGDMGIGRIIVGNIEKIKSAKLENLREMVDLSYNPSNSCVVVVGDIDYMETLHMIEDNFGRWEDNQTREYDEIVNSEPGIYYNNNKTNNAVISIGFKAPAYRDKNRFPIEIISKILGDTSLESRLVQEIRIKRGLAYNLGSFVNFYEQRGVIGFTVVCSNSSVSEVVKIIMNEFCKTRKDGFGNEEIERAKRILETRILLDINDLTSHLKFLGKCATNGEVFSLEHEISQIKKIKSENIAKVFTNTFIEDNLGFAGIGDFDIEEVASILKF